MLGTPPRLWGWLCTHWLPLPASLAWCWWRALVRTQEPLASAWLQAFLDFERPDQVLSADIVETFLAKIATPAQLMDLVEQLMHEGTLLRWDGHQVQEHLLTHVDHTGQWKYHPPRKGVL